MQFRQFFVYIIFATLVFGGLSAQAQQVTTNEDGEKIIVYPNGSWKYFDEKPEEPAPQEVVEEESKASKKARKRREKEARRQQKLAKKKAAKAAADREERLAGTDEPKKKKRSKTKKSTKAKNKVVDPVVEAAARKEAMAMAEQAAVEELNAQDELEQKIFSRASLEQEIKEAEADIAYSVDDIIALEAQLKTAKEAEKVAKDQLKKASKRAKQMRRMVDMPKAKRDRLLAKMNGIKQSDSRTAAATPKEEKRKRQIGETVFVNPTPATDMEGNINTRTFISKPSSKDVILNPPQQPCEFAFDDVDEFSGKRRRDMVSGQLFAYTSDQLRPYMKGRDYITCNAYMSSVSGGYLFLFLEFTILSDNAQREFGVLEKGSILTVKFIDGSTVKLYNNKTDIGVPDPVERSVTYRAKYTIDSGTEKTLRKNEADKIRVVWGTGFEDYEVYELDFFANQLKCLK